MHSWWVCLRDLLCILIFLCNLINGFRPPHGEYSLFQRRLTGSELPAAHRNAEVLLCICSAPNVRSSQSIWRVKCVFGRDVLCLKLDSEKQHTIYGDENRMWCVIFCKRVLIGAIIGGVFNGCVWLRQKQVNEIQIKAVIVDLFEYPKIHKF